MSYVRHPKFRELFKYPNSSVWWAFLPREGKRRMPRESTGHRDDVAAHRWYLERVRSGSTVASSSAKERTVRDALLARIEWLKSARQHDDATRRKLSAETIAFYEKKSLPLIAFLGRDTLLSSLTHESIRSYITRRSETARATTIAKELTTLSMAMRLARKDGVSCPDFRDIKPEDFASVYVPKTRWLSEAEVDALVFGDVLPPHRAAVVAFIVATAATYPSEVVPVRPRHIDKRAHVVHIPGTKAKTRDRTIRVPSYGRRYLDFAIRHMTSTGFVPWSNIRGDLHTAAHLLSICVECREERQRWARHQSGATRPVRRTCKACQRTPRFEPLSPNDLRRTFAQWLVRSGVPYELAYPMMGHGSTKMLEQVYGRRDATAVADLVELALKRAPKRARSG